MDDTARPDLATADGHDRHVPSGLQDIVSAGHEGVYAWAAENFVHPGTRFLDFGCGTGYGAERIVAAGAAFDGVDSSSAAIEYARAHYGGPDARFFVADLLQALPPAVEPRSYDVVFSSEVLEHVVDPFAFVGGMADCVTDRGTCLIGTPNRLWSQQHMKGGALLAASHVMEFTPHALLGLLRPFFAEVELLFRRLPDEVNLPAEVTAGGSRLLRGALAFAREVMPEGAGKVRSLLPGRGNGRKWSAEDISWLRADHPALDTAQCVGLIAVCANPRR